MYYAEKVLRIMLLLFSFYGYLQAVHRRVNLNFCFALIFSSIGSTMFLAGILNILPETTVLILGLGCALGVRSICRRDGIRMLLVPGMLFFAAGCCLFAVLLYGAKFVHYDNFSHWGIVVKQMLADDRFPNFQNTDISFMSYPLGSSCFIYYVVKVCGISSEWMQMLAQAILSLGMVTALFAYAKRPLASLMAALVSFALVAGNTELTSLLVDTLLPLTALAGFCVCVDLREHKDVACFTLLPFLTFLVSIKNSGLLFAVILLVCACAFAGKSLRKHWKLWSMTAAAPLLLLLLWQKHVKLVYVNGMSAKHSLSLQNFSSILARKDGDLIRTISGKMAGRVFSFSNRVLWLLLIMLAIWLVSRLCLHRQGIHATLFRIAFLSYAAYEIGLYAMYLFSMPNGEAINLSGYNRYEKTILILIAGMAFAQICCFLNDLSGSPVPVRNAAPAVCVLCCCLTIVAIHPSLSYYRRQDSSHSSRASYESMLEKYSVFSGGRYMLMCPRDDNGYTYYLTQYLLDPQAVTRVDLATLESNPDIWKRYDYLFAFDRSEEAQAYLEANFSLESVIYLPNYR